MAAPRWTVGVENPATPNKVRVVATAEDFLDIIVPLTRYGSVEGGCFVFENGQTVEQQRLDGLMTAACQHLWVEAVLEHIGEVAD